MMTLAIKATSDCCGDVELRPHDVHVIALDEDPNSASVRSWYCFRCPCGNQVTKPAPADVIALLWTGGVRPMKFTPEQHTGPALTVGDLHDFLIDLALDREEIL